MKSKAAANENERVTVASHRGLRQVALIFGDPADPNHAFVHLPSGVARRIGRAMMEEADRADGKIRGGKGRHP